MTLNASLSQEVGLRRKVAQTALEIFAGWSYQEIDVPLLDHFDQLREVIDPNDAHRTFRLIDRDGNLLVLRSDVTPAIARIFAHQLQGVPLPLRVCYANKIVRLQRSFTREQFENYQIGVELLGASGLAAEIEVILICLEVLAALGVKDFQINVGHVGIYRRLLALSSVPTDLRGDLTHAIANRDPGEVQAVTHRIGLRENLVASFMALTRLSGGDRQLTEIERLHPHDAELQRACQHMRQGADVLNTLGCAGRFQIDLGLIDGPPYYTGLDFRVFCDGVGRPLGGGGRYDDLIGTFGEPTPAVGFALKMDALMNVLYPEASAALTELDAPPGAVIRIDPNALADGFAAALARRQSGEVTRLIVRSGRKPEPLPR